MPDLIQDNLGPNGDAIYEALMKAHEGLTESDSHALNMRLVLLMANQIRDVEILQKLIAACQIDDFI